MKKLISIILIIIVVFLSYNYFTYPNFSQIEEDLSKYEAAANQHNWLETYNNDVQNELKISSEFINKVDKAKLYGSLYFLPKIFDKQKAQRLAEIIADSSSYTWGETTVEYHQHLLFFDENEDIIGITKIDKEKEFINTSPFRRTMKWGKLSKKGQREFFNEINN